MTFDPAAALTRGFDLSAERELNVTLYTRTHVIRGRSITRLRRLTDVLGQAEQGVLVLAEVVIDELGRSPSSRRADFAQVNLDTVLFALADAGPATQAEFRLVKSVEAALIVIPPFELAGHIHVLAGRGLQEALGELSGRFIPLTDADYWSDSLGQARASTPFLAFNRAQAQVLAPYREPDPHAGPG